MGHNILTYATDACTHLRAQTQTEQNGTQKQDEKKISQKYKSKLHSKEILKVQTLSDVKETRGNLTKSGDQYFLQQNNVFFHISPQTIFGTLRKFFFSNMQESCISLH